MYDDDEWYPPDDDAYASGQGLPAMGGPTADDSITDQHSGQARLAYMLRDHRRHDFIHVYGLGWHAWDGTRFVEDMRGLAGQAALDIIRRAKHQAIDSGDKVLLSDATRTETATGVRGILDLAAMLPEFACTVEDLDRDPYALNVANGTLDLRSMTLRPHDPADRITKVCGAAYDPDATGEAWAQFLASSLPDEAVRGFLQRYVGHALVGRPLEHVLAILTGVGRNGKGVFYGGIRQALGDYAMTAEADLFMHREGAHPTGEMDLRGARWVVVSESEKDRKLAEATVKRLTGGDRIKARRMRQDFVEFAPSHTCALVTNFLPTVSGDDEALWARLRVVPWEVVIAKADQDSHLPEKLERESAAILAWAIAGWVDYQAHGLNEPEKVLAATAKYHSDADYLTAFLADSCKITDDGRGFHTLREIYAAWQTWGLGESMTEKAFGDALEKRGFITVRSHGRKLRRGLQLLQDEGMSRYAS